MIVRRIFRRVEIELFCIYLVICYNQTMLLGLIRSKKSEIVALGAEYGYSNFRVFGSVARGDDDEQSDIDLLVDYAPTRQWTAKQCIADLDEILSELLGRKVEIAVAKNLKLHYARFILPEARAI